MRLKTLFKILSIFYDKFVTEPTGPLIYKQQVKTVVFIKLTIPNIRKKSPYLTGLT